MEVTWVSSSGGPLVLCPVEKVRYWSGIAEKTSLDESIELSEDAMMDPLVTHRGEVCAIEGEIGVVEVAGSPVLALCDEPSPTAALSIEGALHLVRHIHSDDGPTVTEAELAERLSAIDNWEPEFSVDLDAVEYVLFDSVEPGATMDPESSRFLTLARGTYHVHTGILERDDLQYVVHRLIPL